MLVALEAAHAMARRTWPEVSLSYENFQAHVSPEGSTAEGVEYPSDLYLCAACKYGQAEAYQALEAAYFPALRRLLGRLLQEVTAVEDVLQEVRTRLFVGEPPKIASYRGRGCLAGWLRSVALHAARDHLRCVRAQRGRLLRLSHPDVALLGVLRAPAAETLDENPGKRERQRCQRAWSVAIRSLRPEERQLLYHHFVNGLSIDALAALYGVHRATAARRIRRATAGVRRRMRNELALDYTSLTQQELDRLAQLTCGDVDVMLPLRLSAS